MTTFRSGPSAVMLVILPIFMAVNLVSWANATDQAVARARSCLHDK
ncbi:MAG: hypothetical protein JNJ83_12935 [Verrucomicrobiaceae bacterium]|nr:hypothetical protein [Verrucomicrobiaceae bacterium]